MTATTTTHDLHTLSPRDFDTQLAEVHTTHRKNRARRASTMATLHRLAGDKRRGHRSTSPWKLTDAEAVEKVTSSAKDGVRGPRYLYTDALEALEAADAAVEATETELAEYNAVFVARGGWSRFFLVANTNGHIHSSMSCSTCRVTTQFSWLPEVSGKSEKDAVEEHGPMLCSVCFPSAPLEWTNYWEKEEQRKQAESCPGSGTFDWVEGTTRFGYAAGNGGTCAHCNGYAAATSSKKIRKHKPEK